MCVRAHAQAHSAHNKLKILCARTHSHTYLHVLNVHLDLGADLKDLAKGGLDGAKLLLHGVELKLDLLAEDLLRSSEKCVIEFVSLRRLIG